MTTTNPTPLFDEPAEACVLGSMLLESDAVTTAASLLSADDFYLSTHRWVFEAILATHNQADRVTVAERLEAAGHLTEIGGEMFLDELTERVPTGLQVRRYAQVVLDRAERRRIMAALGSIAKQTYTLDDDVTSVYSAAIASFADAARRNVAHAPMDDIALSTINLFNARIDAAGALLGLPTGVRDLDTITQGWQKGKLIVIGGRPGAGKSVLMGQSALRAAQCGANVLYYTLEMSEQEVMMRLAKNLSRIPFSTGGEHKLIPDMQRGLRAAIGDVARMPLSIRRTSNITAIIAECEIEARRGKLDLVVVDQLQNATPDVGKRDSGTRDAEIGAMTRALKAAALRLDIPIVLGSALNRMAEGVRPTLATLRECGSIESDADIVALLWPPEPDTNPHLVEVAIVKNRDGGTGNPTMYFGKNIHRFGDLHRDPIAL